MRVRHLRRAWVWAGKTQNLRVARAQAWRDVIRDVVFRARVRSQVRLRDFGVKTGLGASGLGRSVGTARCSRVKSGLGPGYVTCGQPRARAGLRDIGVKPAAVGPAGGLSTSSSFSKVNSAWSKSIRCFLSRGSMMSHVP